MANSTFGSAISGKKAVTTAGTQVILGANNNRRYTSVTIVAEDTNTGRIFVGGSDVASTTNSGLAAGGAITISSPHGFLLSEIWINSSVDTDGVDFYGAY